MEISDFFSFPRPEEESSSSSSDEDEDDRKQIDELLGKVVCVDYASLDKKKALWFPALVSNFCIKEFNFQLVRFMKKTTDNLTSGFHRYSVGKWY